MTRHFKVERTKSKLVLGVSLALILALVFVGVSGINQKMMSAAYGTAMIDKPQSRYGSTMGMEKSSGRLTAIGQISSLQLEDGEPAWIQSGIWVMRAMFNQSSSEPQSLSFLARFAMVQPDGTARHLHKVYGFEPTDFSMEQNNTIHVVEGMATVTMRDGPVADVPITIKVFGGSVLALWIGPDKVDNHFGSGPIYGTLSEKSMMKVRMMSSMEGGKNMTDQAPSISASNAVTTIDNPYYTLAPGTTYTFEGETDEGTERNVVIVTNETKTIMGITAVVVWDRVWLDEELIEETYDWYAQDEDGNVWYLGEDSKEYEDGKVSSTEGSWEAGVDGAEAGIIMEASPKVGDKYKQEYYKGYAEDMGEVISLNAKVTVPYGTFDDCLQTRDWNNLDTGMGEYKYYCKQVGNVVLEASVEGDEKSELIKVE